MTVKKSCPRCARRLVVRRNKETGDKFLGCSQWPKCGHSEPLSEDVRMRLMGSPMLIPDQEG